MKIKKVITYLIIACFICVLTSNKVDDKDATITALDTHVLSQRVITNLSTNI